MAFVVCDFMGVGIWMLYTFLVFARGELYYFSLDQQNFEEKGRQSVEVWMVSNVAKHIINPPMDDHLQKYPPDIKN